MPHIRIALIGTGGISLANHVPGIALCPDARVVALCDVDRAALERASVATGVTRTSTDPLTLALRCSSGTHTASAPADSARRAASANSAKVSPHGANVIRILTPISPQPAGCRP